MTTITPQVGTNRTYTDSDRPTVEFRTQRTGKLRGTDEYSWVQIGLGAAANSGPDGEAAHVVSAYLRVDLAEAIGSSTRHFYAGRANAHWNVRKINHNNKPGITGAEADSGSIGAVAAGYQLTFDVTSDLQTFLNGAGRAHPGFRIRTDDTTRRKIDLTSAELEITYSFAPEAPTGLRPNGQLVSVSKFKVGWNATLDQTGFQVQVGASGFASPTLDTGWFDVTPAASQILDLATTSYGGLTSGTTYFRVRGRNAQGDISDWSSEALVTRGTKPAVSIVQPTSTVWEPTPPHDIDMTGITKMLVTVDDLDAGQQVYSTGLVPTTDGQFTPSTPVYAKTGHHYRINVTAWDNQDWSPLDPAATATLTTTATLDSGTTAPSSITAAQDGGEPWVLLTFTRAVAPDGFRIFRDGVDISGVINALDVFVSGTSYQWIDYTATGHISHTYTVAAVVNNKTSLSNPSASVTMDVRGLWLVHPDTQLRFCLAGPAGGAPAILQPTGTDEATEYRLNDTIIRRVTSVVGPATGTVQGVLSEDAGRSWTIQEGDLWAMRSLPGSTVFRLVQAVTNAPVTVGDLQAYDDDQTLQTKGKVYRGGRFSCVQVGELPFTRPAA